MAVWMGQVREASGGGEGHTKSWDDVTRVHHVLVLDEAEAVHELDLGDLAGAMGAKVARDILLGGLSGQVAQIEPCRGYLGHCVDPRLLA